ncbi:unnamed protein product [Litomosoides sigmodontis]|uniref:Major sperm protein n=1 Tax=Litomosoides sigmodontis TaxID=42156 RepID=A0A3P6T1Q6_LITSI|nr:unnamed protein product [Litomosoides sigmodontis]
MGADAPPSPSTPTPEAAAPPAGSAPPAAKPQEAVKPPVAAIPAPIPPNGPNEPAFQLKLEPETRLEFKSDKLTEEPCQLEVKLTNPTKNRQTFKVKCTSNDIFRVRPALGFCNAESSTSIKLVFSSKTVPDSGRHHFAFYHMKNDEKEKTARQVWTPQSKFEGVRRIAVYFLKSDGTPAPPTGNTVQTGNAPSADAPLPGGAAQAASAPAASVPAAVAAADAKQPADGAKGAAAGGKESPAAAK